MLSPRAQLLLEKARVKGYSSENPLNEPKRFFPVIEPLDMLKISVGNDAGKVSYLKSKYKDAKINSKGELVVKDEDNYWNVVNPSGFGKEDIYNIAGHSIVPLAATAGGALGSLAGPAGTVAGAGLGGVAGEGIRQTLGSLAGTHKASVPENIKSLAAEGAIGTVGESLGPITKVAGAVKISKLPLLGEVSKFVPDRELANVLREGRELSKIPADIIGTTAAKTMSGVHGLPEDLGKLLFSKTKETLNVPTQREMQKEAFALSKLTETAMKDIKTKAIKVVDDAVKALPTEVQNAPINMVTAFEPFFNAVKEARSLGGASVLSKEEFKDIHNLFRLATSGAASDGINAAAKKAHVIKKIIDNDIRWVTGKILPKSEAAEALLMKIRGNIAKQIGDTIPSYGTADEIATNIFKNFTTLEKLGFGKEIGGEAAVGRFGRLESSRGAFDQLNRLLTQNKLEPIKDIPGRMQERINFQNINKLLDSYYPKGGFAPYAIALAAANASNKLASVMGTSGMLPAAAWELLKSSPIFPRMLRSELKLLERLSRRGGEVAKKIPEAAKSLSRQTILRQGPNLSK